METTHQLENQAPWMEEPQGSYLDSPSRKNTLIICVTEYASLPAAENLTKEPPSHKSTLLFLGQIHFQMMLIFFLIHLPIKRLMNQLDGM